MSKAQQMALNIELTELLANYIIGNPKLLTEYVGCSYVVFDESNEELNKLNESLIKSLLDEKRIVVTAVKTKDKANPWILRRITN